jgi:hypothetical protein
VRATRDVWLERVVAGTRLRRKTAGGRARCEELRRVQVASEGKALRTCQSVAAPSLPQAGYVLCALLCVPFKGLKSHADKDEATHDS